MTEEKQAIVKEAKKLLAAGYSQRAIANIMDVPRSTLGDWLREEEDDIEEGYKPRVLFYDLETSPSLAWCFGRWKQNISQDKVEAESHILTYSAKWLGNPNIISNRIYQQENDKSLLEEIHLSDQNADIQH